MAKKHTHQYHKTYPKGFAVGPLSNRRYQWECAFPDCTHYLPTNMAEPIGKMSICNNCYVSFVLEEHHMLVDKPMCTICSHPNEPIVPKDYDWDAEVERKKAITYIIMKNGKQESDITEEEIQRIIRYRRLEKI